MTEVLYKKSTAFFSKALFKICVLYRIVDKWKKKEFLSLSTMGKIDFCLLAWYQIWIRCCRPCISNDSTRQLSSG